MRRKIAQMSMCPPNVKNVPKMSKCPPYVKMSPKCQNVPHMSKCPQNVKMSLKCQICPQMSKMAPKCQNVKKCPVFFPPNVKNIPQMSKMSQNSLCKNRSADRFLKPIIVPKSSTKSRWSLMTTWAVASPCPPAAHFFLFPSWYSRSRSISPNWARSSSSCSKLAGQSNSE